MNADSTPGNPNRYIVLVTDGPYHENERGSSLTQSQVISALADSECQVYISLYINGQLSPPSAEGYGSLTVNGAFDKVNTQAADIRYLYTFDNLRARIMANWPSE